jgi:mannan endo-1,4-beta-mannosidase
VGCPKLFPIAPPPAPPPQISSVPGMRRRSVKPLTKRRILEERRAAFKKSRSAQLQKRDEKSSGVRIRGRWTSTETRRQFDQNLGPAFDGTFGVDSEDILNIPQMSFGTFLLFPDQAKYGPDDPSLSSYENLVQQGVDWITRQGDIGARFNKPVTLHAFGLVTQSNAAAFVPFNSTQAPYAPDSGAPPPPAQQPFGITDQQRDDAYSTWLKAGVQANLRGMLQYQWSQSNLTPAVGTSITPVTSGTTTSPVVPGTGLSPNDGYSIQGAGLEDAVNTIKQGVQLFGPDA